MAIQKKCKSMEMDITEVEWVILKVVWKNEPCAAGTVQEACEKTRGWAYSTVKTTMDRMTGKGLLKVQKIRNLHLFSAAISQAQARRIELHKILKRGFDGALIPMMQFLVENEGFSKTEAEELRKLVKKIIPEK